VAHLDGRARDRSGHVNGKELFYVEADGTLARVAVEAKGTTWNNGAPTKLFERRYYTGVNSGRSYDVSPDGQRFLMLRLAGGEASATPPTLIVVQHWDEDLKRLVPTRP
jgi:hypothetical protein